MSPLERRSRFVLAEENYEGPFAQLCREFDYSRKAGYALLARYREGGLESLADRSRRPHQHPTALTEAQIGELAALRGEHPTWGPKKLRGYLLLHDRWSPACSTIGAVLQREGLSTPRRRVRRTPPYTAPFAACSGPNALWCIDYKGWFRTQDGQRVEPLTITDAHSRFLLRCQALRDTSHEAAYPVVLAAFREYGLPAVIRSDNGSPFASTALGGLSRLTVWWIRLGIVHERIDPGRPYQNGRHERMHGTLKIEGTQPPQANRRAQQQLFHRFRQQFNEVRPHEALGQRPPASQYTPSPRPYPLCLPELEYPAGVIIRRVRSNGEIKWKGQRLYLSETLVGESVGLEQVDHHRWRLWFGPVELALLDHHTGKLIIPKAKTRSRQHEQEVVP